MKLVCVADCNRFDNMYGQVNEVFHCSMGLHPNMAISVQQFIKLANLYNQTMMVMSAVCVQKGGIAMENYVGRFYAADLLEYIVEYGGRLIEEDKNLAPEIKGHQ